MQEVPIRFENEGMNIQGMMHIPEAEPPCPCAVVLHGYTGSRIGDHRMLVKTARSLAAAGIAALRFDFRGSGESEGDFADITLDGEIGDALRSVEFLEGFGGIDRSRVALVGHSLGGAVATSMAAEAEVKSIALWAPQAFVDFMVDRAGEIEIDPYAWLPEQYKEAVTKRGKVDIGGLIRGKPYFESIKSIDPLKRIAAFKGPVLIIQGSNDEAVSPVNAELLYDSVSGQRRLIMIDDADHTFSRIIWERQVIDETLAWFQQTL
jgi:hypothetical protein